MMMIKKIGLDQNDIKRIEKDAKEEKFRSFLFLMILFIGILLTIAITSYFEFDSYRNTYDIVYHNFNQSNLTENDFSKYELFEYNNYKDEIIENKNTYLVYSLIFGFLTLILVVYRYQSRKYKKGWIMTWHLKEEIYYDSLSRIFEKFREYNENFTYLLSSKYVYLISKDQNTILSFELKFKKLIVKIRYFKSTSILKSISDIVVDSVGDKNINQFSDEHIRYGEKLNQGLNNPRILLKQANEQLNYSFEEIDKDFAKFDKQLRKKFSFRKRR